MNPVEYNQKCACWFRNTYLQIIKAGGCPEKVLELLDDELIYLMVTNNLQIKFEKPIIVRSYCGENNENT